MRTDTQEARARDTEGWRRPGEEGSWAQGAEARGQEVVWVNPVSRATGLYWRWAAMWAWQMRRRRTT